MRKGATDTDGKGGQKVFVRAYSSALTALNTFFKRIPALAGYKYFAATRLLGLARVLHSPAQPDDGGSEAALHLSPFTSHLSQGSMRHARGGE